MEKPPYSFDEAFTMLNDIHSQCGDASWRNHREEAKKSTSKYNNYLEWERVLNQRSDISQDYRWELECFDTSFKVLFALMGKHGV